MIRPQPSYTTGIIYGVALDAQGAPMSGVSVIATATKGVGLDAGASMSVIATPPPRPWTTRTVDTTDRDGRYLLVVYPSKDYTVRFRRQGMATIEWFGVNAEIGHVRRLDAMLRPSGTVTKPMSFRAEPAARTAPVFAAPGVDVCGAAQ